MNGVIGDQGIINKLNKAATKIEAACYDIEVPVIIGDNGIVALGNQCRMYAHPANSPKQLAELKRRFSLSRVLPGDNAFRALSKLKKQGKDLIKAALGLPKSADFAIDIGHGAIVFDFALSDLVGEKFFVPLVVGDLPFPDENNIPIGRTLEGQTVDIQLNDPRHSHILISGQTGSGKTVLANTIISGLARAYMPDKLQMLFCSGKPEDMKLWENLPHLLAPPTCDPQASFAMLAWLEEERRRRANLSDKNGIPRLVLYLGECSVLVDLNTKQFSDLLESLVRLGRSERITVIAATQRPRGDQVGSAVTRAQFTLVFAGKMHSPQDSYLALGKGNSGAEFSPGCGAFVTSSLVKFQAAFFADMEKPDRAQSLIEWFSRKQWQIEPVHLTSVAVSDIGATKETDVLNTMRWLAQEEVDTMSINAISTAMSWGYPRASRVFKRLQEMSVLDTERDDNKRVKVNREKLPSAGPIGEQDA